jgi:hypothetical protein
MTKLEVQGSKYSRDKIMAQTDTRSLHELKRETEQTRAGLTDTVEQLRSSVTETAKDVRARVSPAAIKAEVSGYFRSRGEQLLHDITDSARKNPLQAVAVGASVAYPLLRLARAIPAPVLMLGAGLFVAGSKTGQGATQKASDVASDLSDEVLQRGRDLRDQFEDTASAAKSYATQKLGGLSDTVSDTTNQVSRAVTEAGAALSSAPDQLQGSAALIGTSMVDEAAQARQRGMQMAWSTVDAAKDTAASAAESAQRGFGDAKDAGGDAKDAGLEAARTAREKASDLGNRAGKTLFETIEQNPLLVAGVGLLVGGLIASALPRSEIEDELVGGTSNAAKRRAQAAAAKGFDAAKDAVGGAYQEATKQAEAEGLDPDGLATAARDIGQRVRRVAETAVTTAFEPSPENDSSSTLGEKNHG